MIIKIILVFLTINNALATEQENETCITPNKDSGLCQPLNTCPVLEKIYKKKPVSKFNKDFLRKSHCGFSVNDPLVCCPGKYIEELADTEPHLDIYEPCSTPSIQDGNCKPIETCQALNIIFMNKPVSQENKSFLRSSRCQGLNDGYIYVCCPLDASTINQSSTTARPRRLEILFQENNPCVDPSKNNGTCIKLTSCPHLLEIFNKKPISIQNRDFLRSSQCGYKDKNPYVCCATNWEVEPNLAPIQQQQPTPSTPASNTDWLKLLKEKLPQPPQCGHNIHDNIFGGTETEIDEYPWTVQIEFLKMKNKKGYHCGGSLINERYVLTAAHCVKKIPVSWDLTRVRIGEHNTETLIDCSPSDKTFCAPPHEDISVVEKIVHHNYRQATRNQHFDIALLRLEKKVKFNRFVKPICLPLNPELWQKDYTNHTFDVAGWGKTEKSSNSKVKLKVVLDYSPAKDCKTIYSKQGKNIIESQICAGGRAGRDSCNGDSGGPLMSFNTVDYIPYYYLAGIVSFGPVDCGKEDVPGVYTKTASFLEWIAENIFD